MHLSQRLSQDGCWLHLVSLVILTGETLSLTPWWDDPMQPVPWRHTGMKAVARDRTGILEEVVWAGQCATHRPTGD